MGHTRVAAWLAWVDRIGMGAPAGLALAGPHRAPYTAAAAALVVVARAACAVPCRSNNSKLREKGKKDEGKRLREFVDAAYKHDPRIARRKDEERLER